MVLSAKKSLLLSLRNIYSHFNKDEPISLDEELCFMTNDDYKLGLRIFNIVFEYIDYFSLLTLLPILELVLGQMAQIAHEDREGKYYEDFMNLVRIVARKCQSLSDSSLVANLFDELERTFFQEVHNSDVGPMLKLYSIWLSVTGVEKELVSMEKRLSVFGSINIATESTSRHLYLAAQETCIPIYTLVINNHKDIFSQNLSLPNIKLALKRFETFCSNFRKTECGKDVNLTLDHTLVSVKIALYGLTPTRNPKDLTDFLKDNLVAHVDRANHMVLTIHSVVNIGRTLANAAESKEAKELLQCCYQQASSGVLVFSRVFRLKEDDRLKNEIDKLVTLAYMASESLLSKHHAIGMRKILRDHLTWWSSAHEICEKIKPPTPLVKVWVQAQCNDRCNNKALNRTIYKLTSSCPSLGNEALCILSEREHREYLKLSTQYPKLSNQMLRVLDQILTVILLSTRHTLWCCSRLFIDAGNFRLQPLQQQPQVKVKYLSQCIAYLSKVISTMSKLYKGKWSELHEENKGNIQTQLAKAYSMRALCIQETYPHLKSLMEDIENAVKFWCLEPTCKDLHLLYSVYDLLAVKGYTHLHSIIYEKMLNCSKLKKDGLKDLCITLWKSRRISHDICGSPICGDFLTRLSNQDKSWSCIDTWTRNMEAIHVVGFKHKLAMDINIQGMKKMANDLIKKNASDQNQFVVGHMYYDLAETLIGNGSTIEATFFAKEAFQLRANLLEKMFIIPKQCNETFKVRPEVAIEFWRDGGSSDLKETIITPWNILKSYLESSLQCGYLEENVLAAHQYFVDGNEISLMYNLEIFKIRFANALAIHHTRKQSGYSLAKKKLRIAEKKLNANDVLISCSKCKNLLKACMKHEYGNVHLGRKTRKGASFFKEGVKILKDKQWENKFSTSMEIGPNSQMYDQECWHRQSIKIWNSGSLETATYLKLEIIRRRLLMGLLARMGEYYRAQKAYMEEQKVLFERASLILSRSTLCNYAIDVSEEFIESIIDHRLMGFPFSIDYAALTYDICCYILRNTSKFTISKEKLVCGLKNSFTLSRQVPILNQKISRLLSVLYYEDMTSTGGKGLSDLRNGLAHHAWISYFHQASIGTHFNNTLCARMKKKPGLDLMKDDYTEEDLDTCVSKFVSELPDVPLVCVSLIGEDSNLLTNLLSPSPTQVWLQLSRLRKNEEPQVYILPIENSIKDAPSLEPGYTLSITKGGNVFDQVAPIYSSIINARERVCESVIKDSATWERMLDRCISDVLSDMAKWFDNHKETFLGNLIEGKRRHTPIILILDLEIQGVPWESMSFLRSEDVYRMPSVISVSSTLQKSNYFITQDGGFPVVNLRKTYYVLNPENNLPKTENRLLPLFKRHNFEGIVKKFPSPKELNEVLVKNDMFIYDDHDSGLEHMSTDKIGDLDRCSAALLTACSSGALELHGSYKPTGPVLQYMFAGSPAIVSYLWTTDVTDSDRMSTRMIEIWTRKKGKKGKKGNRTMGLSVAMAREVCSLPYYEGAGLICYGIPTRFK